MPNTSTTPVSTSVPENSIPPEQNKNDQITQTNQNSNTTQPNVQNSNTTQSNVQNSNTTQPNDAQNSNPTQSNDAQNSNPTQSNDAQNSNPTQPNDAQNSNTNQQPNSPENNIPQNDEEPRWKEFGLSLITIFFIMIIWSLLGINLLYFLTIKKEYLERLFPTDKTKPPYSDGRIITNFVRVNNFNDMSHLAKETFNQGKDKFKKVVGLNKTQQPIIDEDNDIYKIIKSTQLNVYGFPYKWKETLNFLHPKYFVGNSVMNSYINGRTYVKEFFKFLSDFESGQTILFILVPFILYLFVFIVPIISYLITFMCELNTGIFSTILYSFIFGLSFILPFIISAFQTIQLFITLFLLPSVVNTKKMEIFEDKFGLISFIFCLLVSISAFSKLGGLFGGIITLSLAIIYGILYKLFKNQE